MRRAGIPLHIHALVEFLAGLGLVVAAVLGAGALVPGLVTFAAGIALAGIGLGAVEALPLSTHQSIDRALTAALAAGAVVAALTHSATAALLLLLAAAVEFALTVGTRWSRGPVRI
jgi:hypothetical protein